MGLPDFSSETYWTERFSREKSFEWLTENEPILPLVLETVKHVLESRESSSSDPHSGGMRLLHFGCGTSTLGSEVYASLFAAFPFDLPSAFSGNVLSVVDADYVASSLPPRTGPVSLIQLDVLSPSSLENCTTQYAPRGWDVILDKSTADAISCGPDIYRPSPPAQGADDKVEPIVVLCENFAQVVRKGGRWLCISYSATRFAHLDAEQNQGDGKVGWRVVKKDQINRTFMAEGRTVSDGKGGTRTVYEPETGIWAYVLERV